jgi:hypothetical protein
MNTASASVHTAASLARPVASLLDWLPPADMLRRLTIADNGCVSDPQSGQVYALCESALAILQLARKQMQMDDLLEGLCSDYVAVPARIERPMPDCAGRLGLFVR